MKPIGLANLALALLALLVLPVLFGCSRNTELTAAKSVVDPVEVPLGAAISSTVAHAGDEDKSDVLSVIIFFKIDKSDQTTFDTRFASRKNEARERVTQILSLASVEEKQDPRLESVKEKIREAVNNLLGAAYVKEVIATDVTFGTYAN